MTLYRVYELKKKFAGKLFILGCGHSLHGVDLSPIHEHAVMAVNSAILLMPWDTPGKNRFWLTVDLGCMEWDYWPKVQATQCLKLAHYRHRHYFPTDFYFAWKETHMASSSIVMAIDLAMYLGFTEIVLVGVDHYFKDGHSHFWEYWPEDQQPKKLVGVVNGQDQQQEVFSDNYRQFLRLSDLAKARGVQVWQTSLDSPIEVFQKKALADLIPPVR